MSTIAYPLLVLAVTHSAAKAGYVGAVIVHAAASSSTSSPAWPPTASTAARVMIVADVVARASRSASRGAVLTHHAPFWLILAIAFVDSTASVFFRAGQSGAFRAVVPARAAPGGGERVAGAQRRRAPLGPAGRRRALRHRARCCRSSPMRCRTSSRPCSLLLMRTRFQEERERDTAPLRRQFAEGVAFFCGCRSCARRCAMIAASNLTSSGVQLAVIVLAKRARALERGRSAASSRSSARRRCSARSRLRCSARLLSMRAILLSEFWAVLVYAAFVVWPNVYVLAGAFAVQAFTFPNTDSAVAAYCVRADPRPAARPRDGGVEHAARRRARRSARSPPGCCSASFAARDDRRVFAGAMLVAAVVGTFSRRSAIGAAARRAD